MMVERIRFKYSNDDTIIIDFLLRRRGLDSVLEEYEAKVVPFPLDPVFKRKGNYFINGSTYYVTECGECLYLFHGYMSSTQYDYHWMSDKEFTSVTSMISLFGCKSIKTHIYKRYMWQKEIKEIMQVNRRMVLSIRRTIR